MQTFLHAVQAVAGLAIVAEGIALYAWLEPRINPPTAALSDEELDARQW
jgi:hypothetical protein